MDRYWRRLRLSAIAGDVLAVFLAYTLATGVRFGFDNLRFGGELWPVYPALAIAVALLTVVLGWLFGTYRRWALMGGHRVYLLLVTVATYGVVAMVILTYVVGAPRVVAPEWLVGVWVGSIVWLAVFRVSWHQLALRWRHRGFLVRRLLIAGANRQGIAVAQQLHDPARHGTMVVGFLDDYQRPGTEVIPGVTIVGHPGAVLEHAHALGVDEVVMIAGALTWESQRQLADLVVRPDSSIEVRISPTFYDILTTSAELSYVAYVPILTLNRTRLSGINARAKVLMDGTMAVVLLGLLSPIWLYWRLKASALHVPMLVREPVLGIRRRHFDLLGLNRRLTSSPVLARLPALWNVLCRDLSFVGPRPIRVAEVSAHERWFANLFAMRPGLMGLWRLQGGMSAVKERVALDLYYVRNYTLILDVQILFQTAWQLVRRPFRTADGLARWDTEEPHPVTAHALVETARGGAVLTSPEASRTASAP